MNKAQLAEVGNIEKELRFIEDAKAALIGIGEMMAPESNEGDEQLNLVYRSQAAAIFRFFGNALEGPVRAMEEIKDRLEMAAMKGDVE